MKKIASLILLAACAFQAQAQDPHVWLDTDRGPIIIELDPTAAPVTVENFLNYVDEGFYDGLIFHRVVQDFVIQGGGFDDNLDFKEPVFESIINEADNGLSNLRGTVAMARGAAADSATSQFFINLVNNTDEGNTDLDPGGSTEAGYAVFGEVVFGLSTVDTIADIATSSITSPVGDLHGYPRNPPVIHRAARTDGFPLMPDHSGSWYDADNAGVGFNIEIGGQGPVAIVYWYNFVEGAQFWLTGQASFDWGDSEVTIDLYSHPGTDEGTGFQSPPESNFSDYGTLTLNFDGCAAGTFSYDLPGYGSGSIDVTRLSRPEDYRCQDD